jgi:CheY-like chemotaxis protein
VKGHTLSILIVDDHAIVREGLVRILEGTGRGWPPAASRRSSGCAATKPAW